MIFESSARKINGDPSVQGSTLAVKDYSKGSDLNIRGAPSVQGLILRIQDLRKRSDLEIRVPHQSKAPPSELKFCFRKSGSPHQSEA